jgi:ubiquinone/menaquinone biosynthesis C-methylase UbiE
MNSKKYFETVADQWDKMRQGFFSENVRQKAFETASLQLGKLAADIGAGTGFITEGLISKGLKVIAVDQSKAMLDKLKLKFPSSDQIDCRVGEAEKLPVEDDSVDYVFANMFLHHVENPLQAIKEMTRILRSGGKLVITDLDEHDFDFLKTEHHDRWMGFKRKDVKRWFIEAGLKKTSLDCAGEKCSSESSSSGESAAIDIFVASGEK